MKKNFILCILIMTLISGLTPAFAASSAGSADDPLISKSFIDNNYPSIVLNTPINNLNDSMHVLRFKLNQSTNNKTSGIYIVNAKQEGSLNLVTGSGFILLSGSARLSTCSGTMIDLTNGETISVGQTLATGHRYIAAENTNSTVSIVTSAKIAILGNTTYKSGSNASFTDVSENSWFYDDINYAVQKGLINGRSSTVFAPDDNLTIAEAIKLASCMHQLYNNGSITLQNDTTLWYRSYVDYALQNSIITSSYQNYNLKITRSEFVKIFYQSFPVSEYAPINTVSDNAIPDVRTSDANANQIYTFYRAGILNGSDLNGSFYPNSNIKRSEVAAILTRMFEKDARKSITLS